MKPFRLELDNKLHSHLKSFAALNGKTMREVAIEAIKKHIEYGDDEHEKRDSD